MYREELRAFAQGDRVQLTVPAKEVGLANRELGTVERVEKAGAGRMTVRFDGGRPRKQTVEIDPARHPHLDHGYAVTSHASQGQTADRVLIHVNTGLGAKDLLNNRMAYVAVSRGALDPQLFTDTRAGLGQALGRTVSKESAHAPKHPRSGRSGSRGQSGKRRGYGRAGRNTAGAVKLPRRFIPARKIFFVICVIFTGQSRTATLGWVTI